MQFRRMLPSDIQPCLELADCFEVASHMLLKNKLGPFLSDLMLNDQLWRSVVYTEGKRGIVCFGSCIFISDPLADSLQQGEHPLLLLECSSDPLLRSHILT